MKHMLQGCQFTDIIKLCRTNGVNLRYLNRMAYILSLSTLNLPLRLLENSLYDEKIRATTIKPPVFIIGHYRSGTTHLHNILSQDKALAYIKLKDVKNPYSAILLHKLFFDKPRIIFNEAGYHSKRTPDSMVEGPEEPEEDEFALINMGIPSFYSGLFFFPQNFKQYMKYLSFSDASENEIEKWKNQLILFYKKMAFIYHGKQILNKNPHYTGMIKYLLELFPDAKFIHIYRNPYTVYLSSLRAFRLFMETYTLQGIPENLNLEEKVFETYTTLMQSYFSQKHLIPNKNLVEVKYESLEKNPMHELEKVYHCIGQERFKSLQPVFQRYLDTLTSYQKIDHGHPSPELIKKIHNRLAFTIDKWDYKF